MPVLEAASVGAIRGTVLVRKRDGAELIFVTVIAMGRMGGPGVFLPWPEVNRLRRELDDATALHALAANEALPTFKALAQPRVIGRTADLKIDGMELASGYSIRVRPEGILLEFDKPGGKLTLTIERKIAAQVARELETAFDAREKSTEAQPDVLQYVSKICVINDGEPLWFDGAGRFIGRM